MSKVDDTASKASSIDLGNVDVDVNDNDVLSVLLGPGADDDRWRNNNVDQGEAVSLSTSISTNMSWLKTMLVGRE